MKSEMGILQRTERSMVRAMCGLQLKDRKRSTDLMFVLGLSETMDQLAMEDSVRWYGHMLMREDGHVLRRALDGVVEGEREENEAEEDVEGEGYGGKYKGWFGKGRCILPTNVEY